MNFSNFPKACFLDSALVDLSAQVSLTGYITFEDVEQLTVATSEYAVSEEGKMMINRLFHSIRRGWVKIEEPTQSDWRSSSVHILRTEQKIYHLKHHQYDDSHELIRELVRFHSSVTQNDVGELNENQHQVA